MSWATIVFLALCAIVFGQFTWLLIISVRRDRYLDALLALVVLVMAAFCALLALPL